MIYLIKYVFQIKQRFKSKHVQHDQESIYHANVNVNLMEENVIQINGGITINVNVSVKMSCM